jgi:mobilome CxxCx(11)CxxC protein
MADSDAADIYWEKEFHAFGTKAFFERRANSLRSKLKLLSWASLVVPLVVGALLASFDSPAVTFWTKLISGLLAGGLSTIGLWAVVAGWTESLSKAERSMLANIDLCERWHEIRTYAGADREARLAALKERDRAQEQLDQLEGVTAMDKAWMMRAALFHFQKPCQVCHVVPTSLKPGKSRCAMCAKP